MSGDNNNSDEETQRLLNEMNREIGSYKALVGCGDYGQGEKKEMLNAMKCIWEKVGHGPDEFKHANVAQFFHLLEQFLRKGGTQRLLNEMDTEMRAYDELHRRGKHGMGADEEEMLGLMICIWKKLGHRSDEFEQRNVAQFFHLLEQILRKGAAPQEPASREDDEDDERKPAAVDSNAPSQKNNGNPEEAEAQGNSAQKPEAAQKQNQPKYKIGLLLIFGDGNNDLVWVDEDKPLRKMLYVGEPMIRSNKWYWKIQEYCLRPAGHGLIFDLEHHSPMSLGLKPMHTILLIPLSKLETRSDRAIRFAPTTTAVNDQRNGSITLHVLYRSAVGHETFRFQTGLHATIVSQLRLAAFGVQECDVDLFLDDGSKLPDALGQHTAYTLNLKDEDRIYVLPRPEPTAPATPTTAASTHTTGRGTEGEGTESGSLIKLTFKYIESPPNGKPNIFAVTGFPDTRFSLIYKHFEENWGVKGGDVTFSGTNMDRLPLNYDWWGEYTLQQMKLKDQDKILVKPRKKAPPTEGEEKKNDNAMDNAASRPQKPSAADRAKKQKTKKKRAEKRSSSAPPAAKQHSADANKKPNHETDGGNKKNRKCDYYFPEGHEKYVEGHRIKCNNYKMKNKPGNKNRCFAHQNHA